MTAVICPFCTVEASRIFHAGDLVLGVWDAYPVSPGHALLVPRRHIATWFDATPEERAELAEAVGVARQAIGRRHQPEGFNIGINVGAAAGQTVLHLHVHVIPRYAGDVPDPRGGVRHVIPARGNYLDPSDGAPPLARDAGEPYSRREAVAFERLIAGGQDDPLLYPLRADMDRAHRIDLAVAFVLESGLDLIEPHLRDALARHARVRILTGDYQDVTDPRALRRLLDLEGDIERRVFEARETGFHPKAYLFSATSGESVAYVGSSNLSGHALEHGIEWNYRLSSRDDRSRFEQVQTAFEALFVHPATRKLSEAWIDAYAERRAPVTIGRIEIEPEPPLPPPEPTEVQREALHALRETREAGNAAGLIVMATGLGKTFLAAFDSVEAQRVLFVAHREEILEQAIQSFRRVRPDAHFGRYTGEEKTPTADVLFASIQTLGRVRHLNQFAHDAFDYIVVDEFHHAAAATYRRLIDHFRPRFLLGLTATPERSDGGDLLSLCNENLVYRCDFIEGIRRGLLSPFHYFGVPDEVDYRNIPWRSSRFDPDALEAALATQQRAQNALDQYRTRGAQRTLAFCCSQRHADFMAEFFRAAGHKVAAVHAGDNSDPRSASLERLRSGEIEIIFAVDMFNEGLDIPAIDTVMMLRPTESRLLWLQQFGRGLRNAEGKDHLRVIDYIGNHRTFLLKPQVLFQLGPGDSEIDRVLNNFQVAGESLRAPEGELPPGCEVTYDLEAVDIIRGLLRLRRDDDALRAYYEQFREEQGIRPRAAEAFHDGYAPAAARKSHGSWLRFVRAMGDMTPEQQAVLETHGAFLDSLEITPMTKSYKMLLLLAMLNADALPGEIEVTQLADGFADLARRSAKLRHDVGAALDDPTALRRHLEENPIAAWSGGKGTGDIQYFTYAGGRFATTFKTNEGSRGVLQELVREIAEWRLAEYLLRAPEPGAGERYLCKVSHAHGRPMLFLPDREQHPNLPTGPTPVMIESDPYEADFVKVALNVVRRPGSDQNELPGQLRRWFGPDAGLPGTNYHVALSRADGEWTLSPSGRQEGHTAPVLWQRYAREQIPPLFGLTFNGRIWQTGFVSQGGKMILLVTLQKEEMEERFRYKDRFLTPDTFQWQSQNRTVQDGNVGQNLRQHRARAIPVHLFVRRQSKINGRAAPFVYCGEVDFIDWEGERPITVRWRLREPLPQRLVAELAASAGDSRRG